MVSIFYMQSIKPDCGHAVWGLADCGERRKKYARLISGLREATYKQIHMKSRAQEWYVSVLRAWVVPLNPDLSQLQLYFWIP